ncbi:unnamed protein product, partial [Discosporangium mesarthrocarpum]
ASDSDEAEDGETTTYSKYGRMEDTYLEQKHRLLSEEETNGPCTVVFQVSKTNLERVESEDHGRFNKGDAYLVVHAELTESPEELSARTMSPHLAWGSESDREWDRDHWSG